MLDGYFSNEGFLFKSSFLFATYILDCSFKTYSVFVLLFELSQVLWSIVPEDRFDDFLET